MNLELGRGFVVDMPIFVKVSEGFPVPVWQLQELLLLTHFVLQLHVSLLSPALQLARAWATGVRATVVTDAILNNAAPAIATYFGVIMLSRLLNLL